MRKFPATMLLLERSYFGAASSSKGSSRLCATLTFPLRARRLFCSTPRKTGNGEEKKSPSPKSAVADAAISSALAFFGMGALSSLHFVVTDASAYTAMMGSFGATAVLLYGFPAAPFSQPRNVFGGHSIAAVLGVATAQLVGADALPLILAAPVAVSATLGAMKLTGTVHPPAGGTAMICAFGMGPLASLGYAAAVPAIFGSATLVAIATIAGKLSADEARAYPQKWF